jgi:hypothetical protein
LKAILGHE